MWGRVVSLVEHVYAGSCCTLFSCMCCNDMSNTTGVTSGACLCGVVLCHEWSMVVWGRDER